MTRLSRLAPGILLVAAACGEAQGSVFSDSRSADAGGPTDASARTDSGDGPPSFIPIVAPSDDPITCAQAAQYRSYVGCEYWPTVLANNVWSIFDFAVVVANAGSEPAMVTVTGPMGTSEVETIAPNGLAKIYLPWVPALKGPDADTCGEAAPLTSSVVATASAYHLVSSVPVTVYQFNALEYQGEGGPAGKSWASCPGYGKCTDTSSPSYGQALGCFSFSNDSSLLLPTTALTGNFRVAGYRGESFTAEGKTTPIMGGYVAITATADATHVTVSLAPGADILPGPGVAATSGGGVLDLTLDAGDVAELVTSLGDAYDLSGSVIAADQPVQVITGAPCDEIPDSAAACDHLEQSVFPAETLGQHYVVTPPTGPIGKAVGHVVRLYGNFDGTALSYAPAAPPGCPMTLDAGQVADCGVVTTDFEVIGSSPFAVASFMLGGSIVDPAGGYGDPSQSMFASVEQYRTKYVFLAPSDYSVSFADLVVPVGATVLLDGQTVTDGVSAIAGGYGVQRITLGQGGSGAHVLESSVPVGLQVLGYGLFTSYQYPAGLNLKEIAPPPPMQ